MINYIPKFSLTGGRLDEIWLRFLIFYSLFECTLYERKTLYYSQLNFKNTPKLKNKPGWAFGCQKWCICKD